MMMIDKILSIIVSFAQFLSGLFSALVDFLSKPLGMIVEFLKGVFYFIGKLFYVAKEVIDLFVALFQFFFAIAAGFFRSIQANLSFDPSMVHEVTFPSVSKTGFQAVMEVIAPTGLLTVVPMIAIVFVWAGFAFKVLALMGGQVMYIPDRRLDKD